MMLTNRVGNLHMTTRLSILYILLAASLFSQRISSSPSALGGKPLCTASVTTNCVPSADAAGSVSIGTTIQAANLPLSVMGPTCNAVCDGSANDAAAIQACVTALPTGGGTVLFPRGNTCKVTTGITDGGKQVTFAGEGDTSILTGNGITILSLSNNGSRVENLQIAASGNSADTIGIAIGSGVANWVLRGVSVIGHADKMGTGVKLTFALKGQIDGGRIEYWNYGVHLVADGIGFSNANQFTGAKIRVNNVGVYVPAASLDDLLIMGSTIEGNGTGISAASGRIRLVLNHLENNLGAQTNVSVSGTAQYVGFGNGFYAAASRKDLVVAAGCTGKHVSVGDNMLAGATTAGTGEIFYVAPNSAATDGAGPSALISAVGFYGSTYYDTGNYFVFRDYLKYDFDAPIAVGGGSASKAICWKADGKTLGYCSDTVGVTGGCTCN